MGVEDLPHIGAAEDVAVEHQDGVGGEFTEHVADGSAGAQRRLLGHIPQP